MARRKAVLMLLIAAAVLVSLVGAGLSAADDGTLEEDTTAPVTVNDADGLWSAKDVTVTLTATDEGSGVADTYHRWQDDADFTLGATATKAASPDHENDGEHTLSYYSVDEAGNAETLKTCVVRIDTQAPRTTVSGNDTSWHRAPVTLAFAAADQPGLSGVATTEYRIAGGAWTAGATATVKAPANHSWDGVRTVRYRSADHAGNVESAQSVSVKIDTTGPKCAALTAVSVVQGGTATLRYRVNDALSPTANVTIKVTTKAGKVVKTVKLGTKATNRTHSHRLACGFSPKTYRYHVSARDLAGNPQSKVGVNTLTVKPRIAPRVVKERCWLSFKDTGGMDVQTFINARIRVRDDSAGYLKVRVREYQPWYDWVQYRTYSRYAPRHYGLPERTYSLRWPAPSTFWGGGIYNIRVQVRDRDGNWSNAVSHQ
jgi:hypothetical protein